MTLRIWGGGGGGGEENDTCGSHIPALRIPRSISSWFDKEGKIVNLKFLADVRNLHSDLGKSKKDI